MTLKKIITPLILTLMLVSVLALPFITSAQGLKNINEGIDVTAQGAGVKGQSDVVSFIASLVQVLLGFLGLLFIILIIYGGVEWMTAMGKEDKLAKAKKIISSSVIGLIIILLSYSIAYFVIMGLNYNLR